MKLDIDAEYNSGKEEGEQMSFLGLVEQDAVSEDLFVGGALKDGAK